MLSLTQSPALTIDDDTSIEILPREDDSIQVGQYYWVGKDEDRWLGCVMHVGSNYALISGPGNDYRENSSRACRVHFDDMFDIALREYAPDTAIAARVAHYQEKSNKALGNIRDLTARLGISSTAALPAGRSVAGTGLAVLNQATDVKHYQSLLEEAKKVTLPALFKEVKEANEGMCKWMKAGSLPLQAQAKSMSSSIDVINDRIFNISLYAGLAETVVPCSKGEPAELGEKLRVMQRMLFMDEECLIDYRAGGMEFDDILKFDAWIAEPHNRDRILPFQRCIVAMRVRRNVKKRENDGTLASFLKNIRLGISDQFTYLYIRNGEQVSRLVCELDFDEMIFPDLSVFDPSVEMMFKIDSFDRVGESMTRDCFDLEVAALKEAELKEAELKRKDQESGGDDWGYSRLFAMRSRFSAEDWHPFNPTSVYYDDILSTVSDAIKKYNRIAVIIQGLFDRSEALHPHAPVKAWTNDGFMSAVELVYDSSRALMYGEAPDIHAYLDKCNDSLNADSVVIGQEIYWLHKEAEKECARRDSDYRKRSSEHRPSIFRPYGNDGPGYISKMSGLTKARGGKPGMATFTWYRERSNNRTSTICENVFTKLNVPASELFNVSAYKPGDFRQFFCDPRTRAQYLQWAGLLIAAEEYCAGNLMPQYPVEKED